MNLVEVEQRGFRRQARGLTSAAVAVEEQEFQQEGLFQVTGRPDELGQSARVIRRMAATCTPESSG